MGLFGRDTHPPGTGPAPGSGVQNTAPVMGLTTTIAEGSQVSGDIGGTSDLRIEGTFEGSVAITGIAYVSQSGHASAEIRAATVTVAGKVDGDISADQMIELQPTAIVDGNLLAPKILIREGATLQGRVEMASPPQQGNSTPLPPEVKKRPGKLRSRGRHRNRSPEQSPKSEPNGEKV